jgi:hypothetical protein
MSRGLPKDPIVTVTGGDTVVTPVPPIKFTASVVDPIVSTQSGNITVAPDPPPSN